MWLDPGALVIVEPGRVGQALASLRVAITNVGTWHKAGAEELKLRTRQDALKPHRTYHRD
jgi:hypothetical protein